MESTISFSLIFIIIKGFMLFFLNLSPRSAPIPLASVFIINSSHHYLPSPGMYGGLYGGMLGYRMPFYGGMYGYGYPMYGMGIGMPMYGGIGMPFMHGYGMSHGYSMSHGHDSSSSSSSSM